MRRPRHRRILVVVLLLLGVTGLTTLAISLFWPDYRYRVEPAEAAAMREPPANPRLGDVYYEKAGEQWIRMVWIPPGEFLMGSPPNEVGRLTGEGPRHQVRLAGFWLSATEVTQAQYEAVVGRNPSSFKSPDRPSDNVSWLDAVKFLEKLSKQAGRQYALPSEAQWEYACRAGSVTRYCFGDDEEDLEDYAWYRPPPPTGLMAFVRKVLDRLGLRQSRAAGTHPIGQKRPNAWGLYDMHGNVLEWCQDSWFSNVNYMGAPDDGSAWEEEESPFRAVRGGYWEDGAMTCRSANRGSINLDDRSRTVGFRILRAQE